MIDRLFQRFSTQRQPKQFMAPEGMAAYVIGDVHGCLKELRQLMECIQRHRDSRMRRGDAPSSQLIFLGDLVDRGPNSAGVVDFTLDLSLHNPNVHFIKGNHEEVFLQALGGDTRRLRSWMEYGGRACLRSYGVESLGAVDIDPKLTLREAISRVPQTHIDFLSSFHDYHIFGDYLCVHAGIQPNVPLNKQKPEDTRWIREPFLSYQKPHTLKVIHGHTIVEKPEIHTNRIAIDTGAYASGTLSAVYLESSETEFITSDGVY